MLNRVRSDSEMRDEQCLISQTKRIRNDLRKYYCCLGKLIGKWRLLKTKRKCWDRIEGEIKD